MKLCVKCKHHRYKDNDDFCMHPSQTTVDFINGKTIASRCYYVRVTTCGVEEACLYEEAPRRHF